MEEPNDTQLGRVETFYKAIADSLKGETPTLDETYCRTEEWLAYIASLIQNGGTGGSGGTTNYNQLTNKPFTNLTGTEASPIYLRDLETGGYVLNGNCSPYNGSDVYMGANNAITYVTHFDTVTAVQIFYPPYNQVQYFEVYDDSYTTTTVSLNEISKRVSDTTPYYFDNIATMKSANLKVGDYAKTTGYYIANDGGGAEYIIVDDSTLVDDGGSVHDLANGLKAKMIIEDSEANVLQFGAKANEEDDDASVLNNLFEKASSLGINVINGVNKKCAISSTIYIPTGLEVNNLSLIAKPIGNFTNDYMVFFNTTDGSTWITPYNDWTRSRFNNLYLRAPITAQLNGIYSCGNFILHNLYSQGLNRTIRQSHYYLDNFKLYDINISLKVGSDPAIDCGYMGDGCIIDGVHIHDTHSSGVPNLINIDSNNALSVDNQKYTMQIKNIINGYIALGYGNYELSHVHSEGRGGISLNHGNFYLHNIRIEDTLINSQLSGAIQASNYAYVTAENIDFVYSINNSIEKYENDVDIYSDNTSIVLTKNCYKYDFTSGAGNNWMRLGIKTNLDYKGNSVLKAKLSLEGTVSGFKSETSSLNNYVSLSNLIWINYSQKTYITGDFGTSSNLGTWKGETDTYYYRTVQLIDNIRRLGKQYTSNFSVSLEKDAALIPRWATFAEGNPIRILRGHGETQQFSEYVDVFKYGAGNCAVADNGIYCAGQFWTTPEEDSTDLSTELNLFDKVVYNGKNVEVWASTTPSYGTWTKGDKIINSSPTSGGVYGWICIESGTPGTWKTIGTIGE